MAYGKKYNYYFNWDHNSSNTYYEVAFYVDSYASTVTELTPTPSPFTLSIKGQKDTTDKPIIGSGVDMGVIVAKADVSSFDADFMNLTYKNMIVKLISDPSGTPVTEWTGITQPVNTGRPYQGYKYIYKIKANDGLADLKNVYYTSDGTDTGAAYSGFDTLLSIIKTALSKVADFSELQLDFKVHLGIYSDQMTSTENALKENEVVQELFYDSDGKPDNCYDVISKIITPFGCSMMQSNGYYQIYNNVERSGLEFEYDWATLTQQSSYANVREWILYGGSDNAELLDRGQVSKVQAYGFMDISLPNREYTAQLLSNTEFDLNVTGWTNGDADDNSNTFTQFSHSTDPGVGGVADATYGGSATAGFYNFHSTSTFTLDVSSSAEAVTVEYAVKRNTETPAGLSAPKVQMRLYNGTDGYKTTNEGQRTITLLGDYYVFTDTFPSATLAAMTVTANYLDVQVEVTDASTSGAEFYFDYIRCTQASTSDPKDWLVKSQVALTTPYPGKKEIDFYIANKKESVNDIFSIKDAGGTYTSTWTRDGRTEDRDFTYAFALDWFRSNYTPRKYIRTNFYDKDQDAKPYQLVSDNTHSSTKYYKIVGYTVDYREASIGLDLLEVSLLDDSDQTVYQSSYKQDEQTG